MAALQLFENTQVFIINAFLIVIMVISKSPIEKKHPVDTENSSAPPMATVLGNIPDFPFLGGGYTCV